ncbi:MAG: hypothetical protein JWQ94_1768 [Tardiphaga sp.]|nr:hypothetical protein [Tardiphaga sp.]
MEPRHLIRAAIALSVIGHLALAVGVFFADARPFDPSATQAIAVEVVTPEQLAVAPKAPEPLPEVEPPKPEPPKPEFRLPDLDKATLEDKKAQPEAQKPPAAQQTAQTAAASPPPAAAVPPPPASPVPPPQQQAALQPAPPPPPVAEPDITVKYGVQLGLPDGNGGARATSKADIEPLDIAAFRRHLRSCSTLPAEVARTDKVRIVLRAFFAPNGALKTAPTLIEASASIKGPLLMQAAIQALQACQPYAMLPADKYSEWKVLDLTFTPQDFEGG